MMIKNVNAGYKAPLEYQPDYEELHRLAEHTPIDEIGNPVVFHPTQAQIEAEERARQLALFNRQPQQKNAKQNYLSAGMNRARQVLETRHQAVHRFEENMDDTTNFSMKIGMCLSVLGLPFIGLPMLGMAAGIKYTSRMITGHSKTVLEDNLQDLELCRDPQIELTQKQKAIAKLRKTGRYMQLWEKFCGVTTSIAKFAFGEVHRFAGIADMLFDVNKDLTIRKRCTTPAQAFDGAMSQITYGLKQQHFRPF